jgi:hypothetical protein
MRVKDALKTGDILYRVDPGKLSITVFRVSSPDEVVNYTTTNYENFSLACEKKRFSLSCDKFPFEFKGLLYFLSEDEANSFIKTQIGM